MPPLIKMRDSKANTLSLPPTGSTNIATLWKASDVPIRLVVRNNGPVDVALAFTSSELAKVGGTTGVFFLPMNTETVVVLAPTQGLYAAGLATAGRVSIFVSEAIPLFLES